MAINPRRDAAIIAFIRDRIAEEKREAMAASRGEITEGLGMHTVACGVTIGYWDEGRCICGGPRRRLADLSALSRVLDVPGTAPLARVLVQPWVGHPEFKREWRL